MTIPTTPLKVPLQGKPLDATGNFTPPWVNFYQYLFNRVGAENAPSNTELANAIALNVTGPASAVNNDVAVFDGATGKLIKDSGVLVGSLAPLSSPAFTGIPTAPTAAPFTSTNQIATTAFVATSIVGFGNVVGPASAVGDNIALFNGITGKIIKDSGVNLSTLATNAGVAATYAPIASPSLTGTPTVPTASPGTNTTQAASTAFVTAAVTASTGRLINTQVFTSSGTYTPTSGTTRIIVEVLGGGGGGGGVAATGAGQCSAGTGGGGGGYSKSLITSGFSGATVTVGTAGAGGSAGAAGSAGGTSSFMSVSASGGGGGALGSAAGVSSSSPGLGGGASGGTIVNVTGQRGTLSYGSNAAGLTISGSGGNSPYGAGGAGGNAGTGNTVLGTSATGRGAGGGGTAAGASQGINIGADGTAGLVIIYEYS